MGRGNAAQALDRLVRLTPSGMATRISIFPLADTVLFPELQLPLHVFEPRYRAMVGDALARDRRIGIIQPQRAVEGAPLYQIGCLGKIGEVEALEVPFLHPQMISPEAVVLIAPMLRAAMDRAKHRASPRSAAAE